MRPFICCFSFLSFFFFSLRDQTFWKGAIGSVLKLKSEGHPQHLTDRAETGTRGAVLSPSLISMYFFSWFSSTRADLLICVSGFVRGLSVAELPGRWSLLGGASGSVVRRHCTTTAGANVPLHPAPFWSYF